jgi:predicted 2-oxoglutarate/Fe(II)-dependent dioxygenase YbiX
VHTQQDVFYSNNFFTNEEVDNFCNDPVVFFNIGWVNAEVTGGAQPHQLNVKKTRVEILHPASSRSSSPLLVKLIYGVAEINERKFKVDLKTCFSEALNLLGCAHTDDCFLKRKDSFDNTATMMRKLSCIVMLSSPSDYTGGDLIFYGNAQGQNRFRLQTKKGALIVFPSDMFHEVTPVTSGTRLSLVMWVG